MVAIASQNPSCRAMLLHIRQFGLLQTRPLYRRPFHSATGRDDADTVAPIEYEIPDDADEVRK